MCVIRAERRLVWTQHFNWAQFMLFMWIIMLLQRLLFSYFILCFTWCHSFSLTETYHERSLRTIVKYHHSSHYIQYTFRPKRTTYRHTDISWWVGGSSVAHTVRSDIHWIGCLVSYHCVHLNSTVCVCFGYQCDCFCHCYCSVAVTCNCIGFRFRFSDARRFFLFAHRLHFILAYFNCIYFIFVFVFQFVCIDALYASCQVIHSFGIYRASDKIFCLVIR